MVVTEYVPLTQITSSPGPLAFAALIALRSPAVSPGATVKAHGLMVAVAVGVLVVVGVLLGVDVALGVLVAVRTPVGVDVSVEALVGVPVGVR